MFMQSYYKLGIWKIYLIHSTNKVEVQDEQLQSMISTFPKNNNNNNNTIAKAYFITVMSQMCDNDLVKFFAY